MIRGITADTISLGNMSISSNNNSNSSNNGMFNTGVLYQDALLDANRAPPPQYAGSYGSAGNMIMPVQASNNSNNVIGPKRGGGGGGSNSAAKPRRDTSYDPTATGPVYAGYE